MITGLMQARMGSSRLPGKTLTEVEGKPLLEHIINRVEASRYLERIVVATTTLAEDDLLASSASQCGVDVFRGHAEDVLDRFYQAARQIGATVIVRLTADDPFKDPEVIDNVIAEYLRRAPEIDYVSNTLEPTYPEGLDVEVFSFAALEAAWREAERPSDREHVTPYIYRFPERFRIAQVRHSQDLSSLRWTLDYPEDLIFTREVYRRLYRGQVFGMQEILALLCAQPELAGINAGHSRNEGYLRALAAESAREKSDP